MIIVVNQKLISIFIKKVTFFGGLTPFEAGKSSFVSLIFIFFADIWKVKHIDTVECQKLVINMVNSLVTDPRNTMTVGNYKSPGNRLKSLCEKIFLYRDTDSLRD